MSHLVVDTINNTDNMLILGGDARYVDLIDDLSRVLTEVAQNHQHLYAVIDITKVRGVPIVDMGLRFKILLRSLPQNTRTHIAVIVDVSMASALPRVWETILRRDDVQFFVNKDKALAWITLRQGLAKK